MNAMRLRKPMYTVLLAATLCLVHDMPAAAIADFDRFLAAYDGTVPSQRAALVRSYVQAQSARGGFPVIEGDGQVLFVWFGEAGTGEVRLLGDFARQNAATFAWDEDGLPMRREGGVFHLTLRFEPDARLDYAFLVDGKRHTDPLNPHRIFSGPGDGETSVLSMPGHQFPAALAARPGVDRGRVVPVAEAWVDPAIHVYLPPGYDESRRYPTLYTPDGSAWREVIGLPVILDNLIADGAVAPLIAVMIDAPPQRNAWHLYNPDYLAYLRRVVDHVDHRFATRATPTARVHAGTSSGARAALYVALEAPDLVARIGLLSPSLTAPVHHMEPWFSGRRAPDPSLRVWMSAGRYEGYVLNDTRVMHAWFERHGIPSVVLHMNQGHSFGAWREAALAMLQHHFPPRFDDEDAEQAAPADAEPHGPPAPEVMLDQPLDPPDPFTPPP
jgi:enterochelin esterase-like enzyme